jgi:hypothetical protein
VLQQTVLDLMAQLGLGVHQEKQDPGLLPVSCSRKMASPPQLDNCTFAVITKSHMHAILDV